MKTYLIILLLALVSCRQDLKEPEGDSITILVDITDTLAEVDQLEAKKLKPLFGIINDINTSAKFRVATIENLRYTSVREFSVNSTNAWQANVLDRIHLSDSFFYELDNALIEVKSKAVGRNGSYVAYAISRALTQLAGDSGYLHKRLIVISDLREHTDELSFYRSGDLELLKQNPDSLYRLLDRLYPLPDLEGISISLVFQSRNSKEDDAFFVLSSFWETYYKRKSAAVTIHSSIPEE